MNTLNKHEQTYLSRIWVNFGKKTHSGPMMVWAPVIAAYQPTIYSIQACSSFKKNFFFEHHLVWTVLGALEKRWQCSNKTSCVDPKIWNVEMSSIRAIHGTLYWDKSDKRLKESLGAKWKQIPKQQLCTRGEQTGQVKRSQKALGEAASEK